MLIIIIIIEGLSLLQSIPPTTADKQTQAQKRRGSRSRKQPCWSIAYCYCRVPSECAMTSCYCRVHDMPCSLTCYCQALTLAPQCMHGGLGYYYCSIAQSALVTLPAHLWLQTEPLFLWAPWTLASRHSSSGSPAAAAQLQVREQTRGARSSAAGCTMRHAGHGPRRTAQAAATRMWGGAWQGGWEGEGGRRGGPMMVLAAWGSVTATMR